MKALIGNNLISALVPQEKAYDIWDTKLTGFILRVNPTRSIVYRCEYGHGKRITIGKASILTPVQARDCAKEILADAVKGTLPKRECVINIHLLSNNSWKMTIQPGISLIEKVQKMILYAFITM